MRTANKAVALRTKNPSVGDYTKKSYNLLSIVEMGQILAMNYGERN